MSDRLSRRRFMKRSAGAVGAASLWGTSRAWAGANERVNVAVIGIHGMGQNHIGSYNGLKDVRVAAVCDVDESLFKDRVKKHFTDRGIPKPKIYTDLRELYKDI